LGREIEKRFFALGDALQHRLCSPCRCFWCCSLPERKHETQVNKAQKIIHQKRARRSISTTMAGQGSQGRAGEAEDGATAIPAGTVPPRLPGIPYCDGIHSRELVHMFCHIPSPQAM